MVQLPKRLPALNWLKFALLLYGIIWIGQEGNLPWVMVMGIGVALTLGSKIVVWIGRKRPYPLHTFLLLSATVGLLSGIFASPITLFFMSLKTGLHAHGPEFTPQEIAWTLQQTPLWGVLGALTGLGIGLIMAARFQAPPDG